MRATWASGPLAALCLSAPRAAAALRAWAGRAGAAGAGFPSQGVILRTTTTQGWSLASAHLVSVSGGSRITLSSPLSYTAHFATHFPPQTPPTGMDKGTKVGLSPAWKDYPRASHSLYSRTPPKTLHPSFHIKSHLSSFSQPLSAPQMYDEPVSLHGCAYTEVMSRYLLHAMEKIQAGLAYSPPFLHRKRYHLVIRQAIFQPSAFRDR